MKISAARRSGTRPTVSVVIPCYNYGNYLPAAVASVTGQSGVDLDIIIVDDASTDGSQDVARALAAADPRIRLILHEQNKRHIATYNDGLREARGDYVVLLSADDLLAPGSLERSTALMEHHPEIGLVYGYAADFSDAPPVPRKTLETWSLWTGQEWIARMCRGGMNMMRSPEAVLRRSIMDELVGYDSALPHSADMDMWMRAAALADVGRIGGPDQAYYRVHDQNMHLNAFAGLMTDALARKLTFDEFFAEEGRDLPNAPGLVRTAYFALSKELMRAACVAVDQGGIVEGAVPGELAELASELSPEIKDTELWRRYQNRLRRPASVARRFVEGRVEYRGRIRQWMWRRFGI